MQQQTLWENQQIVKDKETIKRYLAQLMRILAGTPPKGEVK